MTGNQEEQADLEGDVRATGMQEQIALGHAPPELLRGKPSLTVQLLSGIVTGTVLGAANGVLFHYIVGAGESPQAAALWGAELGMAGAIVVVFLRRAVWGPDAGVEIGTALGLLYGIVPGLAIFFQAVVVNGVVGTRALVGVMMAASMVGLVLGGLLDRLIEAIIFRQAGPQKVSME